MIFILVISLFIKIFLFSIDTNYTRFYNFSLNNSLPINISTNDVNDGIIQYYVYLSSNISDNVTCSKNNNSDKNNSFECKFNKNGTYTIMEENNETNKTIYYKNIITIYNYNEEFEIKSLINNQKCFILDDIINNTRLLSIKFDQIINKSLINFTLYENSGKIMNATPFEINDTHTVIGVINQTFSNNTNFTLEIKSQNFSKNFSALNFSILKNIKKEDYPIFQYIKKSTKVINSLDIYEFYELSYNLRMNFTYFPMNDNISLENFESLPQIISPPSKMANFSNNENNLNKYNNSLKFTLDITYSSPGQAILYYHYCGHEYKNLIDFYFVENEIKKYDLSISNIVMNKIFLIIIIILLI